MSSRARRKIDRVLILGHSGFIGSHLVHNLSEHYSDMQIVGEALPDIDLTQREDVEKLASFLDSNTVVIMCAAIKRQLGDNLNTFSQNVAMAVNLCRLLERRPVARLVFFSSAAVYGEEITNLRITEETPVQPTSFYGAAKYACECLFRQVIRPPASLLVLRPALVYGPGDQGGYGPSGFVKATVKDEPITLWGDGLEKREFVYVGDVAKIIPAMIFLDYDGILNLVSGQSYTFKQALDAVSRLVPLGQPIRSRPRTKNKADHGFDNSRLRRLLPDFRFTNLLEGVRLTLLANRQPSPISQT